MKFLLFNWHNLSSEELSNYTTEDDIPDDIFQKFALREGHVYTDPELFESYFNTGAFNGMCSLRIIKS